MARRRKIYIVNKRYQLRYILAFGGAMLATIFIAVSTLVNDVTAQIDSYIERPAGSIKNTGELILPVILRSSYAASAALVLILAAMSLLHYRHTRRLASSLHDCIAGLREGRLCREARICAGDDFFLTEKAFRSMYEANARRINDLKDISADIERALAEAEAAGGVDAERLRGLEEMVARFAKVVSHFKLG